MAWATPGVRSDGCPDSGSGVGSRAFGWRPILWGDLVYRGGHFLVIPDDLRTLASGRLSEATGVVVPGGGEKDCFAADVGSYGG